MSSNILAAPTLNIMFHTNIEAKAYWQIDLKDSYEIDSIQIWNRADCCLERILGA